MVAVDTLLPMLGPKGECAADGVAEQLHPYPLLVSGKQGLVLRWEEAVL